LPIFIFYFLQFSFFSPAYWYYWFQLSYFHFHFLLSIFFAFISFLIIAHYFLRHFFTPLISHYWYWYWLADIFVDYATSLLFLLFSFRFFIIDSLPTLFIYSHWLFRHFDIDYIFITLIRHFRFHFHWLFHHFHIISLDHFLRCHRYFRHYCCHFSPLFSFSLPPFLFSLFQLRLIFSHSIFDYASGLLISHFRFRFHWFSHWLHFSAFISLIFSEHFFFALHFLRFLSLLILPSIVSNITEWEYYIYFRFHTPLFSLHIIISAYITSITVLIFRHCHSLAATLRWLAIFSLFSFISELWCCHAFIDHFDRITPFYYSLSFSAFCIRLFHWWLLSFLDFFHFFQTFYAACTAMMAFLSAITAFTNIFTLYSFFLLSLFTPFTIFLRHCRAFSFSARFSAIDAIIFRRRRLFIISSRGLFSLPFTWYWW